MSFCGCCEVIRLNNSERLLHELGMKCAGGSSSYTRIMTFETDSILPIPDSKMKKLEPNRRHNFYIGYVDVPICLGVDGCSHGYNQLLHICFGSIFEISYQIIFRS